MIRRRILASLLLLVGHASIVSASECVVLLHGLMRTSGSMVKMQDALRDDGFEVVNVDYPSRHLKIEELAPIAVEGGLSGCRWFKDVDRIHFVTHSLGGILLRQYLVNNEIPELGRTVMLGPPNQGSAAVDKFVGVVGYEWINGPAGRQLGKGEESVPLSLGPANFELGVIAGDRSIDPITSAVLENPDDGRVSVEDTKLEGMDDFVVVHHSHAFMMRMRVPIGLTILFLRTGGFGSEVD
jgi:hypothetical protein